MGRVERTSKHVYRSRSEGPDPAGAAEPPPAPGAGWGSGARRVGGHPAARGEAVRAAPCPSRPGTDTTPRARSRGERRPFLTRWLLMVTDTRGWGRKGALRGWGGGQSGQTLHTITCPRKHRVVKPSVPGRFRGDRPTPCRTSSSSFSLCGAGVRHRLESRGSRLSWGVSVLVPHGSAPSAARLKSGRAGQAARPRKD